MCVSCWYEAGTPVDWTPTTGRFVELHRRLYQLEPTGGPLHCELDDWNVDHDTITPMYEIPARTHSNGMPIPGHPDRYPPEVHTICDEIAELLTTMTVPQRLAALAYAEQLTPIPTDVVPQGDSHAT